MIFRKKKTECLCPLCRRTHLLKIWWTGRYIPRKYCPNCLHIMDVMFESPERKTTEKENQLRRIFKTWMAFPKEKENV